MPRLRDVKEQLGSPYLRDHADNPVDWWAWGEDALELARSSERPIFLSVGYAACHWCHVMAHESFEDDETAALLNEHFVPIKVDREERPDVDALYMTATQLSSGHGGWPMSVFMLPDGRPFFTGTYFPPNDRPNQVGFPRLLRALANAWQVQRSAVIDQAAELGDALVREVAFVDHLVAHDGELDLDAARGRLRDELIDTLDPDGGFSGAPKFPHPGLVAALIEADDTGADAVALTLDAMARRGLYDHVGGGFARYCVDRQWHVPHFEKMLIDQALLARTYANAARRYAREDWRDVAVSTLSFVVAELAVPGGYAASLDADAGGLEGGHVTWTPDEVANALRSGGRSEDLSLVLERWTITEAGDLEGRSVPRLGPNEPFLTPKDLAGALDALRDARAQRVQPARDDKVILEWNAQFASACLSLRDTTYRSVALDLLEGLGATHVADGVLYRTQHHGAHATLADVAALADAHLDAFEATGEDLWLRRARESADYLLAHYWDGEVPTAQHPHLGAGVFSSSDLATDLLARPKEIFDGAGPSGHATATRALARLALVDADPDRLAVAQRLVALVATLISQHPRAVSDLVSAARFALDGVEIVVPGPPSELLEHLRLSVVPRSVLITGSNSSPLLDGRQTGAAYLCRGGSCQLPARSVAELSSQLEELAH
ncbi:MAG TPA: thioredoxin domain-containing protein [Acidimicrobiales bacterium]|nr:thioredoxin domain-containing protein [Acidimicrobiales bacterium]